jgi:FMN phosphatase YigB (HAD superfamily)
MSPLLVILDFDGTFTDVEAEGAKFIAHYEDELRGLFGRDVRDLWTEAERGLADPEAGWTIDGRVVAPANCDPYIRATCIAFSICDALGRLPNREVRTGVLQVLYSYCYRFTDVAFRPDAAETLRGLQALGAHLHVVTNSDTEVVKGKLEKLGFPAIPVIGNAKKYVVDPAAASVADLEDLTLPGLARQIFVRRPHYRRVLTDLWAKYGATAASTLVCGDIFELDLALPLALGCRGHLLERPNALEIERLALQSFGERGTSSSELAALVEVARHLA